MLFFQIYLKPKYSSTQLAPDPFGLSVGPISMYAQIHTIAFRGIETSAVTVQIHIANGLPAMVIVGLAEALAYRAMPLLV